jgi:hypothetical protein
VEEVPLIVLKLPIRRQVRKKVEAYMNCLVENIEDLDNGAVESELKGRAVIIVCIERLKKDEYFQ